MSLLCSRCDSLHKKIYWLTDILIAVFQFDKGQKKDAKTNSEHKFNVSLAILRVYHSRTLDRFWNLNSDSDNTLLWLSYSGDRLDNSAVYVVIVTNQSRRWEVQHKHYRSALSIADIFMNIWGPCYRVRTSHFSHGFRWGYVLWKMVYPCLLNFNITSTEYFCLWWI